MVRIQILLIKSLAVKFVLMPIVSVDINDRLHDPGERSPELRATLLIKALDLT